MSNEASVGENARRISRLSRTQRDIWHHIHGLRERIAKLETALGTVVESNQRIEDKLDKILNGSNGSGIAAEVKKLSESRHRVKGAIWIIGAIFAILIPSLASVSIVVYYTIKLSGAN